MTDDTHARASLSFAYIVEHQVLAMQAAYIEWIHGGGAEKAMAWIANTLDGPGLIPTDAEGTDAQAFFDRAIADSRKRWSEAEAELDARAADEGIPGGHSLRA